MTLDEMMKLQYPNRQQMQLMIYGQKERADKLQADNDKMRKALENAKYRLINQYTNEPRKTLEDVYENIEQTLKECEE